ncbi:MULTISPECIES: MFS transporter [Enterococcus]|uniref:MFS transporter n=1 Tax=Candidatus Enterococcus murrayae TaxID=2815321 RepID=A0ABS3HDM3_9ENTE|nr:MFS transporter [Enterococcus sp. MJM16]MBO0451555.1 MFS transporter [Enterococcus sp. MJM16]
MKQEKLTLKVIGAIISTGLLSFCGVLAETAMTVTFPTLSKEFNVNTATVQWLVTIYLLVLAIIVPLSGFFKRSFKNKPLFLIGIGFFTLGIVIDAFAPSFSILLLGRIIQGIGTGIGLPLMFNIILEQVPSDKIGMMMGVGTMIPAIAPAIGPTFGGLVITSLGWRFIFILLIPIMLAAMVVGLMTIEQKSPVHKAHFDVLSLLSIMVMFTGTIIGFSNMGSKSLFSFQVGGAFFFGIVGLISLIQRSKGLEEPILQLELLKNRAYRLHVVCFFILQLVLMGLVFILPNYIQLVNGATPQISGFVVLPGATLGALFTPLGGRILDRFGAKKPIMTGSLVIAFSLLLFTIFSGTLSNLLIGGLYFMFTLGVGFSFGNLMTSGLRQLDETQQANGNAIIMTFQQFAGASGTSIIASIISQSQSDQSLSIAESTINGSRMGFLFLIILFVIELFLLVRLFFSREARSEVVVQDSLE